MQRLIPIGFCAALLMLVGCAAEGTGPGAGTPGTTQETETPAEVTSCAELLESGWKPPLDDPDIRYDPDSGIAEVAFGPEEVITFDLVRDPACFSLPSIGAILGRIQGDFRQAQIEECENAVEHIVQGKPPQKGDIVVDLDLLRAHVVEWCPPAFAEELRRLDGDR